MKRLKQDEIRQAVRKRYSDIAESGKSGCGCCSSPSSDEDARISGGSASIAIGYSEEEISSVPEGVNMGLGCGNPIVIASLKKGETVLDLGSGGGFDCFLASRQVGERGYVIGVDMTPEMISRARRNAERGGFKNVEFRLGEIENLPVPDNSIDVIISNCVINLSTDKKRVFKEAFRVLKPGGRLSVSDIVSTAPVPDEVRRDIDLYTGCVAGASLIEEVVSMLKETGFVGIEVTPRTEGKESIYEHERGKNIQDYVVSADILAVKE
jgi:SAM-dependent methyltransferase